MKNIRLFALAAMVIGILCFGCKQASQNTSKSYGRRTGSAPKENNQSQNGNGQSGEHTPNGPGQSGQTPPAAGGGNDPGTTPPNQNPPAQGEGQPHNPGNPPSQPQQPNPPASPEQNPPNPARQITKVTYANLFFDFAVKPEPVELLKDIDMITFNGKDGKKVSTRGHIYHQNNKGEYPFFIDTNENSQYKNSIYMKDLEEGAVISFKDKNGILMGTFKYHKGSKTFTKVNQ